MPRTTEFLLSFLAVGLLLFAVIVAVAYVIVRVVFVGMAEAADARDPTTSCAAG